MIIHIKGELEIDQERGVVYFHSEKGHSALRICQLPTPVPDPSEYGIQLDISHMHGCSWKSLEERCNAVLFHGPGHQSKTNCQKVGEHEKHYAIYGAYDQEAEWYGDESSTGFFDDPPIEGEKS